MIRASFLALASAAALGCAAPGDDDASVRSAAGGNGGGGTASVGGAGAGGAGGAPCLGDVEPGRCEIAGTGADCTGALDEQRVFVPLSDGDAMKIVAGPQGSMMLVFAARTAGVDPAGPLVDVQLHDADAALVARYRAHVDLEPDPADASKLSVVGLFVVVDGVAAQIAGQPLTALVLIEDDAGARRCGEVRVLPAL